MPELEAKDGSDFFFVDAADPEEGVRKLLAVVGERIPAGSGSIRCATCRCCAR